MQIQTVGANSFIRFIPLVLVQALYVNKVPLSFIICQDIRAYLKSLYNNPSNWLKSSVQLSIWSSTDKAMCPSLSWKVGNLLSHHCSPKRAISGWALRMRLSCLSMTHLCDSLEFQTTRLALGQLFINSLGLSHGVKQNSTILDSIEAVQENWNHQCHHCWSIHQQACPESERQER